MSTSIKDLLEADAERLSSFETYSGDRYAFKAGARSRHDIILDLAVALEMIAAGCEAKTTANRNLETLRKRLEGK